MGVDYSSSMLNIQDNHAYDIKNLLKKNGTLQKRPPFEQVGLGALNGVWECYYKGKKYTIAHIGKKIYEVENIHIFDRLAQNYKVLAEESDSLGIEDKKSWGVFTNDRLYILCGNYLVIKFTDNGLQINRVFNDVDTYIPTTTVGITSTNDTENVIKRSSLDSPNMLSSYRWNTINLDYGFYEEGDKGYFYNDFELDALIDFENRKSLKAILQLNIAEETENGYEAKGLETLTLTWHSDKEYDLSSTISSTYKSADNEVTLTVDFKGQYDQYDGKFYAISSIVRLHYNRTYMPPNLPTQDTMQIMFPIEANNEQENITKCTFGVMYGAGGNRNRLFVSGNPDKPNVDYHTSRRNIYATDADVDLLDSQDLTYFSVYDYCAYGTSNTAITDYQIMGDGSLMVLKEESPNEPNIYFRDSNYETKIIALGDASTQVIEETYPMRVGNIGEGAIKGVKGTLKNLNNDLVFISNNGVFGISSTMSAGQLNSDYKYSYGRSRLINSKLTEYLRNAVNVATIVYDHKYFITIKLQDNTYKTFVGDGRYSYKLKDSIDNEYEYEWFVLDGIEANQYHIINEKLYFSSDKGLFKFDLFANVNNFKDLQIVPLDDGDLMGKYDLQFNLGNYSTNTNDVDLKTIHENEAYLKFGDQNIYQIIPYIKVENGIVGGNGFETLLKYIFLGEQYEFFININETLHPVVFSEVPDETDKYKMLYKDTNEEITAYGTAYVYIKTENRLFTIATEYAPEDELYIKALIEPKTNETCLFTYWNDGSVFAITGEIYIYKTIPCYYLTKSYNFGQSVYSKYLKSMTMINDSELLSYTNFGIITKEIKKRFEENYLAGTNGLVDTYENIFKADLTTGKFSTSFTKDFLLKFNFIQFEFYNNDDTNCVINNFTILYTTGFKTKGVS